MALQAIYYTHRIEYQDGEGNQIKARLDIKVKWLTVHPPLDKQGQYSSLSIAVITVYEREPPSNRDPIKWTFLTNLLVRQKPDAIAVLD